MTIVQNEKRFYITKWNRSFDGPFGPGFESLWKCEDRRTDAVGFGSTPTRAIQDCILDLEMSTSDIHK